MKRIFAFWMCVCLLVLNFVPTYAVSPDFDIPVNYAYLVNLDTGTVVYEKDADTQVSPASLAKIMTAVIALQRVDNLDVPDVVMTQDIRESMYGTGAQVADFLRGEVFTMREVLNVMMIHSACDAAMLVASYVGDGDVQAFVDMMNEKAQELGAVNTHFTNPHGLYEEEQYTTAHDMYLITKYAMEQPGFAEIFGTKNYSLEANEDRRAYGPFAHTNRMLFTTNEYYMPELVGGKTGTVWEDGVHLASVAKSEGYSYLCVVMGGEMKNGKFTHDSGSNLSDHFIATKKLYDWAFETFRVKNFYTFGQPCAEYSNIRLADPKAVLHLSVSETVRSLVPVSITQSSAVIDISPEEQEKMKNICAPIREGDVICQGRILLMGEEIAVVDLVAMEDVPRSGWVHFTNTFKQMGWKLVFGILIFVILLLLYCVLSVSYFNYKRRQRKVSPRSYGVYNTKPIRRRRL